LINRQQITRTTRKHDGRAVLFAVAELLVHIYCSVSMV